MSFVIASKCFRFCKMLNRRHRSCAGRSSHALFGSHVGPQTPNTEHQMDHADPDREIDYSQDILCNQETDYSKQKTDNTHPHRVAASVIFGRPNSQKPGNNVNHRVSRHQIYVKYWRVEEI